MGERRHLDVAAPLEWVLPDSDEVVAFRRGDVLEHLTHLVGGHPLELDERLEFAGRTDDLLKVSGQWVSTLWIEHALAEAAKDLERASGLRKEAATSAKAAANTLTISPSMALMILASSRNGRTVAS